jgi:hypothetical protein
MAGELHNTLAGNVSIVTGESVKPSYRGNSLDADSFLQKVITPIYELIKGVRHCRNFMRDVACLIKYFC